jgi:hypothetical protein
MYEIVIGRSAVPISTPGPLRVDWDWCKCWYVPIMGWLGAGARAYGVTAQSQNRSRGHRISFAGGVWSSELPKMKDFLNRCAALPTPKPQGQSLNPEYQCNMM